MRSRPRRTRSAAYRIGLATAVLVLPVGAVEAAENPGLPALQDLAARKAVALRVGITEADVRVVTRGRSVYPFTGRTVAAFKVADRRTGALHRVYLDGLREVDGRKLRADDAAAYRSRYGKFEPALAAWLARARDDQQVTVSAWFREPAYSQPDRPDPAAISDQGEVERHYAAAASARAAFVHRVIAPIQERLAAKGERATAAPHAPVLTGRLTAAAIRRMGAWDETQMVYLDRTPRPLLGTAGPSIGAKEVYDLGVRGNGVKVGQIETEGRVATANPYLNGRVVQDVTGLCPGSSIHATAVAGIISSNHSTNRGIAPGATLFAAGGCDSPVSHLQGRATALEALNVSVFNLSYGDLNAAHLPTSHDKFVDSLVINEWRTVVAAAGNEAGLCDSRTGYVTSPGTAYNVLTVGAYNHRGNLSAADDTMDPCSSYKDPISYSGDREKPDIVAPGINLQTTTRVSPWIGPNQGGTSLAAPMATGATALLLQKNPGLGFWASGIRAIVAATAYRNIDGVSPLSEKDGAGALDVRRAYNVAGLAANTGYGLMNYDCNTLKSLVLSEPSLAAGRKTRVALSWDQDPAYDYYTSEPSADIDLFVYGPNGLEVARSTSYDNTTEVVEFTTATSGKYTIKALRTTCELSPRGLAWAWYNRT